MVTVLLKKEIGNDVSFSSIFLEAICQKPSGFVFCFLFFQEESVFCLHEKPVAPHSSLLMREHAEAPVIRGN